MINVNTPLISWHTELWPVFKPSEDYKVNWSTIFLRYKQLNLPSKSQVKSSFAYWNGSQGPVFILIVLLKVTENTSNLVPIKHPGLAWKKNHCCLRILNSTRVNRSFKNPQLRIWNEGYSGSVGVKSFLEGAVMIMALEKCSSGAVQ